MEQGQSMDYAAAKHHEKASGKVPQQQGYLLLPPREHYCHEEPRAMPPGIAAIGGRILHLSLAAENFGGQKSRKGHPGSA